ncbi:hypothetical protein BJV82DRAFT_363945 [Fennellomyces sp. T-0311]|nr:hypothetical protein BJV82DRAFT_363945 [Fennellomyces sp. T-0311]
MNPGPRGFSLTPVLPSSRFMITLDISLYVYIIFIFTLKHHYSALTWAAQYGKYILLEPRGIQKLIYVFTSYACLPLFVVVVVQYKKVIHLALYSAISEKKTWLWITSIQKLTCFVNYQCCHDLCHSFDLTGQLHSFESFSGCAQGWQAPVGYA